MTNNSRTTDAILGLMRVSKFGRVAGEDIGSVLEECKDQWKAVVPGTNIGTEHQTKNVLLHGQIIQEKSGLEYWLLSKTRQS